MIKIYNEPMQLRNGTLTPAISDEGRDKTIAYRILAEHNTSGDMKQLKIKFDAMASHDITYVGIIQTARASGLEKFPLPYVLTNCHNSLCAVGGTINEDDHVFGLSAAKRYGGEFVPAHQSVIHSYMREMYAGGGRMILGSDSHTRYGAYGTMAIGEGGPELVKQLLCKTYDITYPRVVGIHMIGKPKAGVGPQDVALAIIGATFKQGIVKNSVMEFFGDGIANLSMDYRNGIDVMTTETSCLSSVWQTDDIVKQALTAHGRADAYKALAPLDGAYYDNIIEVDLGKIECMIALPFHPSNTYTIREFNENAADILAGIDASLLKKLRNGKFCADQGVIAGCSGGTYQNMVQAANILGGKPIGNDHFWLSCYPASQPVMLELLRTGELASLMSSGASIRSAFCGPCFGAGDVPANGAFSIRHTTRNFPNREGSKPSDGQIAYVALMDARSIAASALNGGAITAATDLDLPEENAGSAYQFNDTPYQRVYHGVGKPNADEPLVFGPNITDWPEQIPLPENLLMTVASAIYDPVTTTDELIPSGETSSYRSNPLRLSEFALSRKDPAYVGRAKEVLSKEKARRNSEDPTNTGFGSVVMSLRPGDGSAREQAASCQRVLGGVANICEEYATKRYRSNVINWGMLPFTATDIASYDIQPGDTIYVEGIRKAVEAGAEKIDAVLAQNGKQTKLTLKLENLSKEERDIILSGCLINYYA
ncbi:MAG: hydratase [Ruminococcaceae bacterium]|nr:hydratase [Oscillospiraceae bacterium]